jgi:hypothetical protein
MSAEGLGTARGGRHVVVPGIADRLADAQRLDTLWPDPRPQAAVRAPRRSLDNLLAEAIAREDSPQVLVYDALDGGRSIGERPRFIGTERTVTGAAREAVDELLRAHDHLAGSIRRSHGEAFGAGRPPMRLRVNDTGNWGALEVVEPPEARGSFHFNAGPLDLGDRNVVAWLDAAARDGASRTSLDRLRRRAGGALHRSPSVVMHELAHQEQYERLPLRRMFAALPGHPTTFEARLRGKEVQAVLEALADIRAAAYQQAWPITDAQGALLRDPSRPLATAFHHVRAQVREGASLLQATLREVPWVDPRAAHAYSDVNGLREFHDPVRLQQHSLSLGLSRLAVPMQPALGWQGLEALTHETLHQLARNPDELPGFRSTAAAMRRGAQQLWGARSSEASAAARALSRLL